MVIDVIFDVSLVRLVCRYGPGMIRAWLRAILWMR